MDALLLECVGMKDGGRIPAVHTGRGQDRSPGFLIRDLSPAARTLAITLEDVSHPLFPDFTHWLIWNLPAASKIPGGLPKGGKVPGLENARQGIGYGLYRYAGPKPPKGRRHFYRFTVYALDCVLTLPFPATKGRFLKRAEGHILQQGSLTGYFE